MYLFRFSLLTLSITIGIVSFVKATPNSISSKPSVACITHKVCRVCEFEKFTHENLSNTCVNLWFTHPTLAWYHHQDTGRMQLVPEWEHSKTGHIGGDYIQQGK